MPLTAKERGDQGEAAALRYLLKQGLILLERNYRAAGGEIDLVMLEGNTLVLVEVRLRQSRQFGGAAASVTSTKQRHLVTAAQRLLQQRPAYQRYRARFDLLAIDAGGSEVNWIKHAFSL